MTSSAWLRHPTWAVLVPVPFFVAGHLYDLPGLIDVGVFAVIVILDHHRRGGSSTRESQRPLGAGLDIRNVRQNTVEPV